MLVRVAGGDFFDPRHVPSDEAAAGVENFVVELFLRDAGEPLVSHHGVFAALHFAPQSADEFHAVLVRPIFERIAGVVLVVLVQETPGAWLS